MSEKPYEFSLKAMLSIFKKYPRLFKLLWKISPWQLTVIVLLNIVTGFLPILSIVTSLDLLNKLQINGGKGMSSLLLPFAFFVGVTVLASVTQKCRLYCESRYQMEVSYALSVELVERTKEFDLSDFENSETQDQLRRLQHDVTSKPYMLLMASLSLMNQGIGLISISALLVAWKAWLLGLIVIMPFISALYTVKFGQKQYQILFERTTDARRAWYLNMLLSNDTAFKEIRLYRLTDYLIGKYRQLNESFLKKDTALLKERTSLLLLLSILDEIMAGVVCFIIVMAAVSGEILIGSTMGYFRCVSSIQSNVQGLLGTLSNMLSHNLYMKQLFDYQDMTEEKMNKAQENHRIESIESIEFKSVSFKYQNRNEYALKNLSFVLNRGDHLALVGQNGSGKSTLVKLIAGFYDHYEGEILINGISMRQISKPAFRQLMGVVFQDFNRYEMTLQENIGLGNLDKREDIASIKRSLDRAAAQDFAEKLPNGLATQLGSWFYQGIHLSGGQWQRVALARAFMRDSDCYLLDEPSSALDVVAEFDLMTRMLTLMKNKIGLFVTHKLIHLRYLPYKIMVFKEGELIEVGSHESLMSQSGHYKYLFDLQSQTNVDGDLIQIVEEVS